MLAERLYVALKLGVVVVLSAGTSILICKRLVSKKSTAFEKEAIFHKVLFFPDEKIPCRSFLLSSKGCRRKNCPHSHDQDSAFLRLIRHILDARRSINLCMFSVTCNELAEAVLTKYRQGAVVRVITDTEYMNLNGSRIADFMEQGIAVRHDRSAYLMHHKFLTIDEEIVITGSFNWTHAAVIGNNENVLVTNHQDVVRPYLNEFERLWNAFGVSD